MTERRTDSQPRFTLPWRSRDRIRADLNAELEFHYQMRTEELMRRGLAHDDARREAEREFGDDVFTRRYCETLDRAGERETRRADWLSGVWQDLKATAQGVTRRPGYSIAVILTMTLGVGANTATFSVLDSVLLRQLPFPHAERLVTVDELNQQTGAVRSDVAPAEYLAWAASQRSFDGIAVHSYSSLTYTGGDIPERLDGARVSANFFDVLGVRAALGRTFAAGEDRGVNHVVVITDGTWKRLFGSDAGIVGRSILLGGEGYTVIGVLRPDFVFPGSSPRSYYAPFDLTAAMNDANRAWKFHRFHGFGRLADGVSLEAARTDLTTIAQTIARDNPATSAGHLVTVLPLQSALVANIQPTILALMGAALFVLLIAAANLANLALSRAMVRQQEFAVRAALGAGRGRLMRLALTECVTLAMVGGAIGLALAWWGTPALLKLYPDAVPPSFDVHVSPLALVFSLATAILTGVGFGLAPALASRGLQLSSSMRSGAHGSTSGRARTRGRSALVVTQVALAMILVIGAGLLIRTLQRMQALDLGFQPQQVNVAWVSLSGPRYQENGAIPAFWDALLARLRQQPGIESVALAGSVPLAGGSGAGLAIEGRANVEPLPTIRYSVFSEGLLGTLGIALKNGRDFSPDDRATGRRVVLINEAAARKYWPGQDPLGARIRLGPDPADPWSEVIGIIGDYRQEQLNAPAPPLAVTLFRQDVWSQMFIAVRSKTSPVAVTQAIRTAVREMDPSIAVEAARPLAAIVNAELGERRFAMTILSAFGGLALLLAVVGVYGVISYGVTSRRREFGVRIALGAERGRLVAEVLSQGAVLAGAGLLAGGIASIFLTNFLSRLLYEVPARDAATFAGAASVLCVATLAASWIPARRAAAVDPIEVLRDE